MVMCQGGERIVLWIAAWCQAYLDVSQNNPVLIFDLLVCGLESGDSVGGFEGHVDLFYIYLYTFLHVVPHPGTVCTVLQFLFHVGV